MQQRLDFIQEYNRIWEGLVDILDINTVRPEQNTMERRFFEKFNVIMKMALQDDSNAHFQLAILGQLLRNLRGLKENRPQIFPKFKSKFHEIEHDRYFGWRCEVDTAAYLTKNGVEYTLPDPPDFRIETSKGPISIECTSTHFGSSKIEAKEKIKDKVSSKSDKSYFNPSTALFIDATNVYHVALKRGEDLGSTELKSWVRERIELLDLEIGSVHLLHYHGDVEESELIHGHDRIDNSPSDELFEFLEEYAPSGQGSSRLRWFPPEP